MPKRPARRTVVKAFGAWLDYAEWKRNVQMGNEAPPEGYDLGDMAKAVITLNREFNDLAEAYLDGVGE